MTRSCTFEQLGPDRASCRSAVTYGIWQRGWKEPETQKTKKLPRRGETPTVQSVLFVYSCRKSGWRLQYMAQFHSHTSALICSNGHLLRHTCGVSPSTPKLLPLLATQRVPSSSVRISHSTICYPAIRCYNVHPSSRSRSIGLPRMSFDLQYPATSNRSGNVSSRSSSSWVLRPVHSRYLLRNKWL